MQLLCTRFDLEGAEDEANTHDTAIISVHVCTRAYTQTTNTV